MAEFPLVPLGEAPENPFGRYAADPTQAEGGVIVATRADVRNFLYQEVPVPLVLRSLGFENVTANEAMAFVVAYMPTSPRYEIEGFDAMVIRRAAAFMDVATPGGWRDVETNVRDPAGDLVREDLGRMMFTAGAARGLTDLANYIFPPPVGGADPTRERAWIQTRLTEGNFNGDELRNWFIHAGASLRQRDQSSLRKLYIQALVPGLVALCTAGTITEEKIDRLNQGLRLEHAIEIDFDTAQIRDIHNAIISKWRHNLERIETVFSVLEYIFSPQESIRLNNILRQSKAVGVSAVSIIQEAYSMRPQSRIWGYLVHACSVEWDSFVAASRRVARDPFMGTKGRNSQELVKNTKFTNVLYAAVAVHRQLCGSKTIRGYRGPRQCSNKLEIDAIIEAEMEESQNAASYDRYKVGNEDGFDLATHYPDFAITYDALQ